jgi:hypothetical protein
MRSVRADGLASKHVAALGYVRSLKAAPSAVVGARGRAAVAAEHRPTHSNGTAPTVHPQNETSPFPQRKRLAAEDAWLSRAAAKGLLMTLAATASREELLVPQVYITPRGWPPIRPPNGHGTAPSPPPARNTNG